MKRTLVGLSILVLVAGVAYANTTGITADKIRTAVPANTINLSGASAAEGASQSLLRSDATFSLSGILTQAFGGTGAGALTCSAGQWLTSNGTAQSCTAVSITANSPLTGTGTSASHLACQTASGAQAGCLAAADWTTFNAKQAGPLTGDVTTSGAAATLANTAVTPASYGSTSLIPSFTVDGKGRLTAAASNTASLPASAISSGSFADARLTDAYSGSGACAANTWASTLTRDAAPTCTQPSFSNVSGTATAGQIPSLDTSKITTGTLAQARGGTGAGALTCSAGDFITSNGTAQSCATPTVAATVTNQHTESSATVNCLSGGSTLATLTIAVAGTYIVEAGLTAEPSAPGVEVDASIKKNGSTVTGGLSFFLDNGTGVGSAIAALHRSVVVTFAISDVLTLVCTDSLGTGHAAGYSLVAMKLQ